MFRLLVASNSIESISMLHTVMTPIIIWFGSGGERDYIRVRCEKRNNSLTVV